MDKGSVEFLRSRRRVEVASRSRMDTVDRRLARCKAKRVCLEAFCHRRPLDRRVGDDLGDTGRMEWHDGGYDTTVDIQSEHFDARARAAGRMEEALERLDWAFGLEDNLGGWWAEEGGIGITVRIRRRGRGHECRG